MARTYFVKKARKAQGNCRVCGKPVNIGDSYKYVEPRYRPRIVACTNCVIPISMTSSSKMVAIWEAQEQFRKFDSVDDGIAEALRDLANTAREVGEEYQQGADNQREYFPDSETAQENEDKATNLSDWADELESAADDAENAFLHYC